MHNPDYSEVVLRLNAIIETATDGIITIDDKGRMELVNPAAAKLFGYTHEEMIGQNVNMLMPAPYNSEHDHYLHNYLLTREKKIIGIGREVNGKRKDGTCFPFRLSISEVQFQNRRIFTGIVHDLSEQKRAEKALREEKERTQRYLDIANTILLVISRDQKVSLINRKGCEVLGYEEEDIIGKNWFELVIAPNQQESTKKLFDQLIQGHAESIDYYENEIITRQGEKRLIAWHNALIRDDTGVIVSTISSGIDITKQRAAEERIIRLNSELEERVEQRTEELAKAVNQLLETNNQLKYEVQERGTAEAALRKREQELQVSLAKEKELSELKSRFVSLASHEFRTPLSTILSSADLIEAYQKEEHQEKRLRHTNRIKSAVANLTNILNDFLSLSRLEEGKILNEPVAFDLSGFCNEALDEIQDLLKPGQSIRRKDELQVSTVFLDKKILKNVLFNLLSNAIKYSEEGKPIDCQMITTESELKIIITDYGIGIPEPEQQYLFTPFFRAHNVENIQGTGLGLNIVKRYIDLMKGEVTFKSASGLGTTFYVSIPLDTK